MGSTPTLFRQLPSDSIRESPIQTDITGIYSNSVVRNRRRAVHWKIPPFGGINGGTKSAAAEIPPHAHRNADSQDQDASRSQPSSLTSAACTCFSRRSGGRLWRFKYRFAGKEKLLALGAYPDLSLAKAREARDDARKAAGRRASTLPLARQQEKREKAEASANDFETVAREWLENVRDQVGGRLSLRHAQALRGLHLPWHRPSSDRRRDRPGAAGPAAQDRDAGHGRDGAQGGARLRAGFPLWHRHRPLRAQPRRRSPRRLEGPSEAEAHGGTTGIRAAGLPAQDRRIRWRAADPAGACACWR